LADLLVSWKKQQGEDIRGRFCVPIDRPLRISMYKNLIETLIQLHGYSKDDFEGLTYRRVMEASINPNSERKEKWREAATADWKDALDDYFPQKILVSTKAPQESDYERPVSPPRAAYVPPTPEIELEDPLANQVDKSELNSGIAPPSYAVDEEFLKSLQGPEDE
jgi:hypothetical protein